MRPPDLWRGPEPAIYPPLPCDTHGGGLWHGLWHVRQVAAWKNAWASCLINTVQHHGGGMYTVPSTSEDDKWYAVWRYPLAPDGYLYICQCKASETAGVVCQHAMAVYLFRLRHVFHWRLKRPEGGADARGGKTARIAQGRDQAVAEREARDEARAEAV